MEAEYQTIQDEKEARQKQIQDGKTLIFNQQIVGAKVEKQAEDDYQQTGGLTEEQL